MSEHISITDLISQLQSIARQCGGDTQVVLRKSTGWTGVDTQYFDMDLVAVPASKDCGVWYASMTEDYESQRTEIMTGQVPSVSVLAFWASDYDITNIHPDEVGGRGCFHTKLAGDE